MKITKKQWIVGGAVALVLAGGGTGIVVNNQAQAQAEKTAQEAKTAHDNLIKAAKTATEKAETFKAEADVKSAQDAIKKLDEKDKTSLISRVEKVRQNWDLVNKADKAVVNAEKVQNDANVKTAQTAIDKIKAEIAKSKKTALQKRLDKVKTNLKLKKDKAQSQKAEEARKAAAAQKAVTHTSNSDKISPSEDTQAQVETPTQAAPAPTDNGGASTNNAYQPTPQAPVSGGNSGSGNTATPNPPSTGGGNTVTPPTGGGSGNSGGNSGNGGGTTPPPVTTYTGWVRRGNGQIIWTSGGYKTLREAAQAAASWLNSQDIPSLWDGDNAPTSGAY